MRDYIETENLIYKSIKESNLFDSKWESIFYSNLLKMMIDKSGGIEEFINDFSPYMDIFDMETYFKDDLIDRYGEDCYKLLVNHILGDDENEIKWRVY